jgi:hypothetical protein
MTSTTASTTTTTTKQAKARLTDANPDDKCLKDNANIFQRLLNRFSLHNGAYMLNIYENYCFYAVFWICVVLVGMHLYAFTKGFWDGILVARDAAVQELQDHQQCNSLGECTAAAAAEMAT